MYEYRATILKIVDGDTVDVDIDLGFGIWIRNERVRIAGIDTPESRTRDKEEKKFGLLAKARLKELLKTDDVILQTQIDKSGEDAKGKFGRILGDFILDNTTAGATLIAEGHAVAYNGESKEDLVEAHMANRARLIKEGKA
jgi:micrococcal nuclease